MGDITNPLRQTSRGIVLRDDHILLIERWRPGRHYFSIPGGGIEPGETPEITVLREIAEETGCQVELGRKLYEYIAPQGNQHHFYLCHYVSGQPHLPADSPEALDQNEDNNFAPTWAALDILQSGQFNVWQPVIDQLVQDLSTGFSDKVVYIKAANVLP